MEKKEKTTFCVHIFDISPCVFTKILSERAHWVRILIPHPTITHTAYFWWTLLPQKQQIPEKTWWWLPQKQEIPEKTWWWHHHHVFSGISCFWGSGVCKKYAVCVLVGCQIKFRIQLALSLKIWVKTQGDMLKIQTKRVVFFLSSSKINKYYFIIYFLRRPILKLKISLMG